MLIFRGVGAQTLAELPGTFYHPRVSSTWPGLKLEVSLLKRKYPQDPGRLENDEFSGVSRLVGYLCNMLFSVPR